MQKTLPLLFLFLGLQLFAQKDGISFGSKHYEFGSIEYWDNPPAIFAIKNDSEDAFTILPTLFDKEIYAKIPKEKIQPGQRAAIHLYYYTPELGKFNKEVKLFISSSDQPIRLRVSGEILSLAQNALTACPTFGRPGEPIVSSPETNVVVPSKKDREVIYESEEIVAERTPVSYDKSKAEILGSTPQKSNPNYNKSKAEILGGEKPQTQNSSYSKSKADILGTNNKVEKDDPTTLRTIKVVDGQTRIPLSNSVVKIFQDGKLLVELNTGTSGKTKKELDIGKYTFEVFKEGYELLNTRMIIFEKSKNLVVNLNQLEEEAEPPAEEKEIRETELPVETPVALEEKPLVQKEEVKDEEEKIEKEEADLVDGQLSKSKFQPNNIIFLVDISRSMEAGDKMVQLKESMKNLTGVLRDVDLVTLIAYAYRYEVVMEPTIANDVSQINNLIDGLQTKGKTYGVKGLEKAYEIIEQHFNPTGNNQIILATDGMFNSPNFSERELFKMVRDYASDNIKLSVVGFGQDEKATKLMKRIAEEGTGNFIQISKDIDNTQLLVNEIKSQSTIY